MQHRQFHLDRMNTTRAPFESFVASHDERETRRRLIAETIDMQGLISYVDSGSVDWFQFKPGSRWKTLFEDPKTGQRAILVQWDAGYRMGEVDHHERDEIVYVLSGTFVQNGRSSRRQTAALSSRSSPGSEPDKGDLRRSNWRGFATSRDALRWRCPMRAGQLKGASVAPLAQVFAAESQVVGGTTHPQNAKRLSAQQSLELLSSGSERS
jgi:hypothetical protein